MLKPPLQDVVGGRSRLLAITWFSESVVHLLSRHYWLMDDQLGPDLQPILNTNAGMRNDVRRGLVSYCLILLFPCNPTKTFANIAPAPTVVSESTNEQVAAGVEELHKFRTRICIGFGAAPMQACRRVTS